MARCTLRGMTTTSVDFKPFGGIREVDGMAVSQEGEMLMVSLTRNRLGGQEVVYQLSHRLENVVREVDRYPDIEVTVNGEKWVVQDPADYD